MLDPRLLSLLSGHSVLSAWQNLVVNSIIDGGGADTGGINKLPHGGFTWSGGVLSFHPARRPAGQPWDNGYYYQTLAKTSSASLFALSLDFGYVAPADFSVSTAFECEAELCEAGVAYNMGIQSKGSHVDGPPAWRMFNQGVTPHRWDVIPGLPTPGPTASIVAYFSVDRAAKTTTHEAIQIGGQLVFPIGVSHPAIQKWPVTTNYLHTAVQLDSDGKGSPQSVKISKWEVRAL